jgi:hypothetical protein
MKIYLHGKNKDKFFTIDDEDLELISKYKWYLSTQGYAKTTIHRKETTKLDKNRNINIAAHRLIMGNPENKQIDHINRDRLDNRKSNLRLATHIENNWNKKVKGLVGVSLHIRDNIYRVRVGQITYGSYKDKKLAALVYDKVIRRDRGEFAVLNYPEEELPDDFKIPNFNKEPRRAKYISKEEYISYFSPRQKWRFIYKKKMYKYFNTEEEAITFKREYLNESKKSN